MNQELSQIANKYMEMFNLNNKQAHDKMIHNFYAINDLQYVCRTLNDKWWRDPITNDRLKETKASF